MALVRTVGHGTLPADAFAALVRDAGIAVVVDVRRFPGSRKHPHFRREAMAAWLPAAGVDYVWLPALGGRRGSAVASPDTGLRNAQFRAYAAHMRSAEFAAGLAELLALDRLAAIMCAESLWWRCHRRLVADHLVLVEEVAVEHLFHDGRLVAHAPTPEARRVGGGLVYAGA